MKLMRVQYERSLEVLKASLLQDSEKKIRSIVDHNEYLLKQRIETKQKKLPEEGIHVRSSKSTQFMSHQEYIDRIDDILRSKSQELELLQRQHDDFKNNIQTKFDNELEEISKKQDRAKAVIKNCENEIFDLYKYVIHLEGLISSMIAASHTVDVEISPPSKSQDMLPERFKLTHRIAASCVKRLKSRAIHSDALDSRPQTAESDSSFVDKLKSTVRRKRSYTFEKRPQPFKSGSSSSDDLYQSSPSRRNSAISDGVSLSKEIVAIGGYFSANLKFSSESSRLEEVRI